MCYYPITQRQGNKQVMKYRRGVKFLTPVLCTDALGVLPNLVTARGANLIVAVDHYFAEAPNKYLDKGF